MYIYKLRADRRGYEMRRWRGKTGRGGGRGKRCLASQRWCSSSLVPCW